MVELKVHKIFLILSLIFVFMLCAKMNIGFSMYLGETFIGNVRNRKEANAVIDIFAETSGLSSPTPSLYLKILPKNNYDAPHKMLEKLKEAHRIETKIFTETVPIPFDTEVIKTDSLFLGEETIQTEGANGERTIIKRQTAKQGQIIKEDLLSETVSRSPVSAVILKGTKPKPSGTGSGTFALPLSEIRVSSSFGPRKSRQHTGIDFAADHGTHILAADDGTVIFSDACDGYGNLIILDHKNGYKTYYAHASILHKKVGATVEKGEVIAEVGNTGNSTGPHLHFEIRKNDMPQNPAEFLSL